MSPTSKGGVEQKSIWSEALSEPALWFLVGIIIMTVFVILFMLYFKKKLCFKHCGGCDSLLEPEYERVDKSIDIVASTKRGQKGKKSDPDSSQNNAENSTKNDKAELSIANGADSYGSTNFSANGVIRSNPVSRRSSKSIRARNEKRERLKKRNGTKSYDQDGGSSSSDSDEENIRHLSKSIRRASLRRSRGSLRSSGSIDKKSHSLADIPRDMSRDYLGVDNGARSASRARSHGELSSDSAEFLDNPAFKNSTLSVNDDGTTHSVPPHTLDVPKSSSSPAGGSIHTNDWEIDSASAVYRNDAFDIETEEQEIALAQQASAEIRKFADADDDGNFVVEPISACGTLDVALQYTMSDRKLQVTIVEARDLPSKDRGGATVLQVRIVILPLKKKKFKTKVQHIKDPRFGETFKLNRVSPEDLRGLGLRLRLYGIGKVRDRLIGEAVLRLEELNLIRDPQLTVTLQLEPRTDINRGDSDTQSQAGSSVNSSMQSLTHGGSPPELLTGLSYNPPTGRLCVEVIKGSHFRNMASPKAPDTYVKLTLLNSACQEMAQSKTGIRRSQPNPVFKEQFYFQVALFQLSEVTLMMSVYNRKSMKRKDMIGWVSLGRNSSSENEEQHWEEMKEGKGQQVCRWSTLVQS